MPLSDPVKARKAASARLTLVLGVVTVVLFFLGSGFVAWRNIIFIREDAAQVTQTHEVISALDDVLSLITDAESGQRGYVITVDDAYLEPFSLARSEIENRLNSVERLVSGNEEQLDLLGTIRARTEAKFLEMESAIEQLRTAGFEAARAVVETDRGRVEMEALQEAITQVDAIEQETRARRIANMDKATNAAIVSGILTAVLGIVLSLLAAVLISRAMVQRREQEWVQTGKLGLASAMFGEQQVEKLGESILGYLARYVGAHAAALYVRRGAVFRRAAAYGVPSDATIVEEFETGDGLLGQAAREKTTVRMNDVPDGYLTLGSGLGRSKPRNLVIAAIASDDSVNGVLELGFVHSLNERVMGLLHEMSEPISIAIRSALYRENLQELLEETQRQAEELQAQSEELRVNNEELEEQSRALKESQSRLELQQAELEQTNSQLEEQAQLLEVQRNDVTQAKNALQAKADELERASKYKSDFLANMSHELRTPLNSSLILSKLLADNPDANLTAEQVKYAETIHSSGNDLLSLINDILDLSKIEAGHMEVNIEPVPVARMVADLARVFEPMARNKGLEFVTDVDDGCPEFMETDRKRLEQVLRNLLSNALKFTEQGRVELTASRDADGRVAFAVKDSGIGIAEEHQLDVFEAFQQADGTISRKYGGTGLGLSISRELVNLLGGSIDLQSAPDKGSTFTVHLPEQPGAPRLPAKVVAPAPVKTSVSKTSPPPAASQYVRDDREELAARDRSLLVVEDDESFARILYDLAHDLGFKCLIANCAEDALVIARQYFPSAVLLDVGLPDNSGLSVLDRLKQDNRTRHIPVHVISAADHTQTALSLGAVGYMLKPVKRDELVDALKRIESRILGGQRRVLIVEDDAVQRESLIKLLGSSDVEPVAVGTASECLDRLRDATFDCMVLDLSLPDASGYSLLETLSTEDTYSFPPVIVYTGRDLSSAEEQKLRRYSKSIIIKGAKSPERLLDEVTLFLHRVVSEMPAEQQKMLEKAHNRDAILEGRRILVVEDDVRNIYALTNILEPRGAVIDIARNGLEAIEVLEKSKAAADTAIDLVLMDVMMPEMDGLAATREIRKRQEWKRLPIIALTAKAMKSDQERCIEAGANDYMAKPLDVEKLLSLVRVWMPR